MFCDTKDKIRRVRLVLIYASFFTLVYTNDLIAGWSGITKDLGELFTLLIFHLGVYIAIIIASIGLFKNKSWVKSLTLTIIIFLILRFILQLLYLVDFRIWGTLPVVGDILIRSTLAFSATKFIIFTIMDLFACILLYSSSK